MSDLPAIRNETPQDDAQIGAVVEGAFGPGRYAKAAERLREGNTHLPGLSFVAEQNGRLVGTVRLWPVHVGGRALVLLGPIAVDNAHRKGGLGQALVERACAAATAAGFKAVMLVGNGPWFEKTGFSSAPGAGIVMPGPVDQRRVLVKALSPGGADNLTGLAHL